MSKNAPRNKVHAVHLSYVFEAGSTVGDMNTRNYAWQSVESEISCAGVNGDDLAEHGILLASYGSAADVLSPGMMYALKSRLIGSNNDKLDTLYHESTHAIAVGGSATFEGNLINNAGVTSLGIIISKEIIVEPQFNGKNTVVIVVRHADYDPISRSSAEYSVEYRCRPVRNLENCQSIFQLGREVMLSGYIIDRRSDTHMWVVEIYTVAVCSGHEVVQPRAPASLASKSGVSGAGRARLPRRDPSTPTASTSKSVATPAVTPSNTAHANPCTPSYTPSPKPLNNSALPLELTDLPIDTADDPTASAEDDQAEEPTQQPTRPAQDSRSGPGKRARKA